MLRCSGTKVAPNHYVLMRRQLLFGTLCLGLVLSLETPLPPLPAHSGHNLWPRPAPRKSQPCRACALEAPILRCVSSKTSASCSLGPYRESARTLPARKYPPDTLLTARCGGESLWLFHFPAVGVLFTCGCVGHHANRHRPTATAWPA